MSFSAFAATTNPQECLKQKKALDRRYCLDSYLETIKDTYAADKKAWAHGLPEKTKAEKVATMEQEITAKKDYLNLMKSEIELQEKHLAEVKTAKVAAPKKEKKKKHGGFRIKL
jgi:hypothetical protein